MKDWISYLKECTNSDVWGFVLLDYYHWQIKQGYKDGPSHFIDKVISKLPKEVIDPVAFHKVLLSVCVHLLGSDFRDMMGKSISWLNGLPNRPSKEQLQAISLHYAIYGKQEIFEEKLVPLILGIPENRPESEDARVKNIGLQGISASIEVARKCVPEDNRIHPKVGVVIIKNGRIICEAYRGEINPGEHAEYTALSKKCGNIDLNDAILITTLEPCTARNHDKKPCALHIADRGINKVIIGMMDPNPDIRGKGVIFLQERDIKVELFPSEYQEKLISLNREYWNQEVKKYKIDIMKVNGSEPGI